MEPEIQINEQQFDPKKIFEDAKLEDTSQNNNTFKYIWKRVGTTDASKLKYKEERKNLLGQVYDDLLFNKELYHLNYQPFKNIIEARQALVYDETLLEKSLLKGCLTQKCQRIENNHYLWPISEQIYKGTKYFYTTEQERQFHISHQENNISYFGSLEIAYTYAKRYFGGIQVYEPVRPLKLFNLLNDNNIKYLMDKIAAVGNTSKSKYNATFQVDSIGSKCSGSKLIESIKIKYGVGINKFKQAQEITKYNYWKDGIQWLYEPLFTKSSYKNFTDKSYTGWYYGAGQLDRICAFGIMKLILQEGFDGILSTTGYYSPFMNKTITGSEMILWNSHKLLKRNPFDEYDSEFLINNNFLPFDPKLINFNEKYASKNTNHQMIRFIQENFDFKQLILPSSKQKFIKLVTLNIHNFESLQNNVSIQEIIINLTNFIKHYDLDVCCFEEYYDEKIDLSIQGYNIIKNASHTGLVIFYKKTVNLKFETSIKLENHASRDQRRFGLYFIINNKLRICLTHLEVGQKLKARSGSNSTPQQMKQILIKNSQLRIQQLKQIISFNNPHVILGDLNFIQQDDEFQFLISSGYITQTVEYTCAYLTQVDYIFYKDPKLVLNLQALSFKYSDHVPVIAILDEDQIESYQKIQSQIVQKKGQDRDMYNGTDEDQQKKKFRQIKFQCKSRSRSQSKEQVDDLNSTLDELMQRKKKQGYRNQSNHQFHKY